MVNNYYCPMCNHYWGRESNKGASSRCGCGAIAYPLSHGSVIGTIASTMTSVQYGVSTFKEVSVNPKLYQVSAIELPTAKAQEAGAISRVVLPTTDVLALTLAGAAAAAVKNIKGEWEPSRTSWVVRELKNEAN